MSPAARIIAILLSGLVVAQIALSLALLITAGLFLRTLQEHQRSRSGLRAGPRAHCFRGPRHRRIFRADTLTIYCTKLLDRVAALPGVPRFALTDWVPLTTTARRRDAYPEGYVPQPHESLEVRRAGDQRGYFATMGCRWLRAAIFTMRTTETAPRVVIVDQTAANHYWPHQDPIGRRLKIWGDFVYRRRRGEELASING